VQKNFFDAFYDDLYIDYVLENQIVVKFPLNLIGSDKDDHAYLVSAILLVFFTQLDTTKDVNPRGDVHFYKNMKFCFA